MNIPEPEPLPLRTIPVPLEVTAVEGCDCGGIQWHRSDYLGQGGCSIWALTPEQRQAAIDAAEARLTAFTDSLNARLRAALTALDGDPGWKRAGDGDG